MGIIKERFRPLEDQAQGQNLPISFLPFFATSLQQRRSLRPEAPPSCHLYPSLRPLFRRQGGARLHDCEFDHHHQSDLDQHRELEWQ
ncbi:hypothetical protein SAY86_008204 [Trapa natans]|uniref:Uncharacterized protein n=1 Tax=Trapa natans TaxID=22666 RepID=A0AAN7QA87_TRANT|nr:hypothetical protein SAY86_008204 [Trapa natans]